MPALSPLEHLLALENRWRGRRKLNAQDAEHLRTDLFTAIRLARTEVASPPVYTGDVEAVKAEFAEHWGMQVSDAFAKEYAAFVFAVTGVRE